MDINRLYKELANALGELNNLRRWSDYMTEPKYDEISKQALNSAIAFCLAKKAEEKGTIIKWDRFPKLVIYRSFYKVFIGDNKEAKIREMCEIANIPPDVATKKITEFYIEKNTDKETVLWLSEACGTTEELYYKAATIIATELELRENKIRFNGDYFKKLEEVILDKRAYENLPGFSEVSDSESDYFKAFKIISNLRNKNRWSVYSYLVSCSVLGHLLDTAIFAYLMELESSRDEEKAAKYFFMGIFHDIPEAFTGDIPSPVKDSIPGLREASEIMENRYMENEFYPLLESYVQKAVRGLMIENEENKDWKAKLKGADYMSSSMEIWRQFEKLKFIKTQSKEIKKVLGNPEVPEGAKRFIETLRLES